LASPAASAQFIVAGGSMATAGSLPIDLTRIGAGVPQMPSWMGGRGW
jgi:hypothetical protein